VVLGYTLRKKKVHKLSVEQYAFKRHVCTLFSPQVYILVSKVYILVP